MIGDFVIEADSETFDSPAGSLGFDEILVLLNRYRSMVKVAPLAAPQHDYCTPSGRARWPRAARHSQCGPRPVGAQPRPLVLERAASKVAGFTSF